MKKNFYKIILSLFLLTLCSHLQAQQIRIYGDTTANSGDSKTYTMASRGVTIYAANWTATGGTVTSQNMSSVTITWNTNPGVVYYNVTSSSAGTLQASRNVTVTVSAPANPPAPTIVNELCANAELSKTGTIPTGEMWYWQTSPLGTDETYAATSNYNVTSAGSYYIRSKNLSTGIWSGGSGSIFISGSVGGTVWYQDSDGDGLGDPNAPLIQCAQPSGYVSNNADECPTTHGQGAGNGCVGGPTLSNENYIYTIVPQKEITNENMSELIQNGDALKSVTYFDGLGRTVQSIAIKQSPLEKDIIHHIGYDNLGRQIKEFLPFASANNLGLYDPNAESNTKNYYKLNYAEDFENIATANINPYSEKVFEASPMSRIVEQTAPGNDWAKGAQNVSGKEYSNGHTVKVEYASNTSSEVRIYTVNLSGGNPVLQGGTSYYAAGRLTKVITKDENWIATDGVRNTTEEFKNLQGQVVLKRTYALTGSATPEAHDTYYVFDDYGNLSFVLPPLSNAHANIPTSAELSGLCYQYKYDYRNRVVEKKLPGKGWEYVVYDKLDRPVMTQDANQVAAKEWLFIKYDELGRTAYSGKYTHSSVISRAAMQSLFNTTNDTAVELFESRTSWGSGSQNSDYTNNDFPSLNTEILTVNYYDDYAFDLAGSTLPGSISHEFGETLTTRTQGLATGAKVKVLGTSNWITTVNYYDTRGRAVYVYAKNDFLGTTDIVQTDLDFAGKVIETFTAHTNTNDALSTQNTRDQFEYDHAARLTEQRQYLNESLTGEIIVQNTYNELGQLITKGVGGKTSANDRLQTVDYKYNVRGWLRSINDVGTNNGSITLGSGDLFGYEINYNNATNANKNLYNGNIAQTLWKTSSTNNTSNPVSEMYTYTYDDLNRLTSAVDNTGNYNLASEANPITYDKNGNIITLHRQGHINSTATSFDEMDNLVYEYEANSNRLKKVTDSGDATFGFKDGANYATEYTYDANGNMLRDYNKGMTADIEYNHLNLPIKVTMGANKFVEYTYDAAGIRLQKKVTDGSSITYTKYAGGYNYQKIGSATEVLQFIPQPEGYIKANVVGNTVSYSYVYEFADHLGNVRVSYSDSNNDGAVTSSEIIEEKNYYPFGLSHRGYKTIMTANGNSLAQKYGYNGKELNDDLGLNWHDFSARNYDAALGRWMNIDPLAEQMRRHSPYNYAFNNPVYFIDPDGMAPVGAFGESLENKSVDWSSSNPDDWEFNFSKKGKENPKEGQSREKKEYYTGEGGIEYLDKTYNQYYHSGGINGSKAGWYNESDYLKLIAPLAERFGNGIPSIAAMSFEEAAAWLAQINPTEGFGNFLSAYGNILYNRAEQQRKFKASGVTYGMEFDSPFFVVGGISKFFTGAAAKTEVRIALGVSEYLDDFAKLTKASTWKSWGAQDFQAQFLQVLANPKSKIHFNLDGIDSVWSAIREGAGGLGRSRATSWELFQIYSNQKALSRTVFYKNGKVVQSPF